MRIVARQPQAPRATVVRAGCVRLSANSAPGVVEALPKDVVHRVAVVEDNDAILAFMAAHAMQAGLALRFDRAPDFFALARIQGDYAETHLFERAGRVVALASLIVRDGYIGGRRERVVYLCDLRVTPDRRIAGRWRQRFLRRMQAIAAESGARFAHTAILRDNHHARNALVTKRRMGFERLRGYATVMLLARKPFRRPPRSTLAVRHAGAGDRHALRAFLDADARARPFGIVFDDRTFGERLTRWPNLSLEHFLVAIDADGAIAGCVAPWDHSPLKRIVIDALRPNADLLRRFGNLFAPLSGRPVICQPPGAVLPDIALSHLAVRDRDPTTFAALLDVAVRECVRRRRFATISLCLYDDDPLWPALDRFLHHDVPMDLYTLPIGDDPASLDAPPDALPGFEFYLA